MPHTLEFYWDFSSPFAYFANTQVESLAERTSAVLVSRPMLLGAVFRAVGQVDVPLNGASEAKRRYFFKDLERLANYWNVPFRFPSRFPMGSVKALRSYLLLPEERREAFRRQVFEACWARDLDIADDTVLAEIIGEGGKEIVARTSEPAIKDALFAATKRAIDAGVFGAPTWVIDGEHLFWGQDRIPLVERALLREGEQGSA